MKINKFISLNNLYLFLSILAVTLLGFALRFYGVEKPTGMWHDEILTYTVAAKDSILAIIDSSSPRPLYFLILHFWIEIFGNSELGMRILSVILGTFAVPAMYFAGAELHKTFNANAAEKISSLGITAALLTAINSFLIYYSQEIRQYALLTLICALSAYGLLRLINSPNKKNLVLFLVINFVLIFTHFISTIFIFFEIIFLAVYFKLNRQIHFDKKFIKYILIAIAVGLPFFIVVLHTFITYSIHSDIKIINSFESYRFDYQTLFLILQNWFSPSLVGIYNNISDYLTKMLEAFNAGKALFVFIPVLLSLLCIFQAVFSERKTFKPIHIVFLAPFLFLIMDYILSLTNTYIIISRYTLICLPFALLVVSYGIFKFKNKFVRYAIIFLLTGISLLYITASPKSAPKLPRPEGQKLLQKILTSGEISLSKEDIIMFPIGKSFSYDHFQLKPKALSIRNSFFLKRNVHRLIGLEHSKNININNARELLKIYLAQNYYPESIEDFFMQEIYNEINEGRYFILAHNAQLAYYTPDEIRELVYYDDTYNETPLKFLLFSKVTNDLFNLANKHMELVETRKEVPWIISIFKKTN